MTRLDLLLWQCPVRISLLSPMDGWIRLPTMHFLSLKGQQCTSIPQLWLGSGKSILKISLQRIIIYRLFQTIFKIELLARLLARDRTQCGPNKFRQLYIIIISTNLQLYYCCSFYSKQCNSRHVYFLTGTKQIVQRVFLIFFFFFFFWLCFFSFYTKLTHNFLSLVHCYMYIALCHTCRSP